MPPLAAETGSASRIVSHKEIMLSLVGLSLLLLTLLLGRVSATVVLMTSTNETFQFGDMESSFAARIPAAGILGVVYAAEPANACTPLTNAPIPERGLFSSFVVVARGDCSFEQKVRVAQAAGFNAVIVYNNEDNHDLVTMSGNGAGIHIHAVFVSESSGEAILNYADDVGTSCYIRPAFENTAWSVMAVSFISLLAVAAVLATFFFVRRHRLRHLGSRLLQSRESLGMSATEVKALPVLVFKCGGDGNGTAETCAICLEDYEIGEKLRMLPCHHEFHTACIDQWLLTRRPFCPVCKRDAHTKTAEPPASENTPLLGAPTAHHPVPTITSIPAATQTSPVGSPARSGPRSLGSQTSLSFPDHGGDLC
ncbi:hypothetical protein R1flu_016287 [Riccia fluitans]|uniref:RING-type E3 ubiquitin transferase n=1 Tax=Riccia fluitans TaxID=41844 RepID=A0ABD1YLG4_9MARC